MRYYLRVLTSMALSAIVLAASLAGCAPASPTGPDDPSAGGQTGTPTTGNRDETIVFADAQWATSTFLANLAAFIVREGYGYDADVTPAAHMVALQSITTGEIDAHMDVQVIQMQDLMRDLKATGKVDVLGVSTEPVWLGWLVPRYMIEGDPERGIEPMMPDFEDVFDLARYWELFEDPEDSSKGLFVNSVPGWDSERINRLKVEAYGLDQYFNVATTGSEAALTTSMYAAYQKGEPWLGYYYSPGWILAKLDMYRVPEPEYDESLWNDESKYACGYPLDKASIVGATNLKDRAPEVADFLARFSIPIDELNQVLLYMQEVSGETDDVLHWFLTERENIWTPWVSADVAQRVNSAIAG